MTRNIALQRGTCRLYSCVVGDNELASLSPCKLLDSFVEVGADNDIRRVKAGALDAYSDVV